MFFSLLTCDAHHNVLMNYKTLTGLPAYAPPGMISRASGLMISGLFSALSSGFEHTYIKLPRNF